MDHELRERGTSEAKRTIAFADLALAKIRSFDQPVDPRTYAAWFTYATNCRPSQNAIVNRKIALNGSISADEIEKIYGYGPPDLIAGNLGPLAAGVVDHVGQVKAMVDAVVGAIAAYRAKLDHVTEQLDRSPDQHEVSAMVEALVSAAKSMETQNQAFTARLQAARRQITELQEEADSLRVDDLTDRLTSLANRKHFDRQLERCMAEAEAKDGSLCLLLTDIDHLKNVNDTFGHLAGDEVLRLISHSHRQHVQPNDVAARIGGDEFAVILPAVQLHSALTVADHIRCRVMATHLMKRTTGESIGRLTVSGGIATYRRGESPWALMQRADRCLEAAKRHGCNRVVCDSDGLAGIA
jgi:diguanylate cyclase